MSRNILMLVDYRGEFYSSALHGYRGMDRDLLRQFFDGQGYELTIEEFRQVDFRSKNYAGQYILYQSSDDSGLHYKSYIEDILLGLDIQGAVLIPPFKFVRAHENKVFAEILRDLSDNAVIKNIQSKGYGTFEDFLREINNYNYMPPVVFKTSAGAGSRGVRLLRGEIEKKTVAERLSRAQTAFWLDTLKRLAGPYLRKNYLHRSTHRAKFIIQNYVPNLKYDYKVLVYERKFYVLRRLNRKNDFRASGSGMFEWITEPQAGLLDFVECVFNGFDVPFLSSDVAFDGEEFHLLEFQFVLFGPLALERSSFYFTKVNEGWIKVDEKPILEREIATSVTKYIAKIEQRGGHRSE